MNIADFTTYVIKNIVKIVITIFFINSNFSI